jgi:signal transduction histidine kinase
MLKNLFENAIKYSKNEKIEITLNKNSFEITNTFN